MHLFLVPTFHDERTSPK